MMQPEHPMPDSPRGWLEEIADAYKDAREAIPFGALVGEDIKPDDLFHMAPVICLKFRGLRLTARLRKQATEAALSSYIATRDESPEVFSMPQIAFAFVYLASHFGLDLLDGDAVSALMEYVEEHQERLLSLTT